MTKQEEQILFHTLGYDYQPRWNDDRGGYRNWFGIYPSEDNGDYIAIKSLVEKGYMEKHHITPWNEEVYSVTDKGIYYVTKLWLKKKKKNKPSRSKRRYQAYFDWTECYASGTFKDFLHWLSPKEEDRILYPEEIREVEEFKRKWNI